MEILAIGNDLNRQAALTRELHRASNLYYGGNPIMSDLEFDTKLAALAALERASGFAYDISPTIKVGAAPQEMRAAVPQAGKLADVVLPHLAMSLDKVKYDEREDLVRWLDGRDGVLSIKEDGLTLVLSYKNGQLVQAATRGDGKVGEDVTHNAQFVAGIPLTIPYNDELEVRGECLMAFEEFERIVNEEPGGDEYMNARNLAVSTIRDTDKGLCLQRTLTFRAFTLQTEIYSLDGRDLTSQDARMEWLQEMGFFIAPYSVCTPATVIAQVDEWEQVVSNEPFPSDGLVLTYRDQRYAESLGNTVHHWRGAIALKWTDEKVPTTIRDIFWSVGRTGAVTPVAIFDTVRMGLGSDVSKASCHNLSYLDNVPITDSDKRGRLGIGCTAYVYLANMIIPQVASIDAPGEYIMPTACPVCGAPLVTQEQNGIRTLWCKNRDCAAKHIKGLARFASKDAADIEGLSEKKIAELVDLGFIEKPVDFYRLKDKDLFRLRNADGWGKKSVDNLLDAIEKSRDIEFPKFLYGLNIDLLGHDLSAKLDKMFHGDIVEFVEFVNDPDEDKLASYEGIGAIKAGNIMQWCRMLHDNPAAMQDFTDLVAEFNFATVEKVEQSLEGLTFVITGAVYQYKNRDEFKASVLARGGKVSGSVSKKTDYLVANDKGSGTGKMKTAAIYGTKVLTEAEFIEKFGM